MLRAEPTRADARARRLTLIAMSLGFAVVQLDVSVLNGRRALEHRDLGLSDVARITGLSRAAARRLLLTLVTLGYVHHVDGRFSLRPRVLELGYAYLSGLSLPEVAQPHMEPSSPP